MSKHRFLVKSLYAIWYALAFTVIIMAVLLSVARMYTPKLAKQRPRLEKWATELLQRPVQIGKVTAKWHFWGPQFTFYNVVVFDPNKQHVLLNIKQFAVAINVIESAIERQIKPSKLIISGAKVSLWQQADGSIRLTDSTIPKVPLQAHLSLAEIVSFLASEKHFELNHINLTWHGNKGLLLPITGLKIQLHNHALKHRLLAHAKLAQLTPSRFTIALDVVGDPNDLKNWHGRGYLKIRQLLLGQWFKGHNLAGMQVTSGNANITAWIRLAQSNIAEVQSIFNLHNVNLQADKSHKDQLINHMRGHLLWQRQSDNGWSLAIDDFGLRISGQQWPVTKLSFSKATYDDAPIYHAYFDHLNIQRLQFLLTQNAILPKKIIAELKQLQPQGALNNSSLQWQPTRTSQPSQWQLTTEIKNFSEHPWQQLPSLRNISGHLQADQDSGELNLASHNAVIYVKQLFHHALAFKQLKGFLHWNRLTDAWFITANNIGLYNSDMSLTTNFVMKIPLDHSGPSINLVAHNHFNKITAALNYLPEKVMSADLLQWLHHGITAGKALSATVLLHGNLAEFPFKQGQGKFNINAELNDVSIHYQPNWPPITKFTGKVVFDGNSMSLAADGKIAGIDITQVNATIPQLDGGKQHAPVININGKLAGDLQQAMWFMRNSPIAYLVGGKKSTVFDLKGPMQLGIKLSAPLTKHKGQIKVTGDMTTHDSVLQLPKWHTQVYELTGQLHFTQSGIWSKQFTGKMFKQPIKIAVTTTKKANDRDVIIKADSVISVASLKHIFAIPILDKLTGMTNYHLMLTFPNKPKAFNELYITTGLQGIQVDLPEPYNKAISKPVDFDLTYRFAEQQPSQLKLHYKAKLGLLFQYLTKNDDNVFNRGRILLGGGKLTLPKTKGLYVSGYINKLDWSQWEPIVMPTKKVATNKQSAQETLDNDVRMVDLNVKKLLALGRVWHKMHFVMSPTKDSWSLKLNSQQIAGQINIPKAYPKAAVNGELSHLRLQATKKSTVKSSKTLRPQDVPPLTLKINDFAYGKKHFGKVFLHLTRGSHQVDIKELVVKSPVYYLKTTGYWRKFAGRQQTRLRGELLSSNLGEVLKRWQITKNLVGGKTKGSFLLSWYGFPYEPDNKSLNGEFTVKIENGRIIGLGESANEKLGLGRVLNLLSLQTLPRRLSLNFSDLTKKGYSFDTMKGTFTIHHGTVKTQNAYLDGPVAYISVKGRIGLVREDYDLLLTVSPYLTSSLPIIATIAGGPIAGAVTWVANRIFSSELRSLTAHLFKVTGPWSKPVFKAVGEKKMKRRHGRSKKLNELHHPAVHNRHSSAHDRHGS